MGKRNTKFFHSYVKGRRKRLRIHEITTREGDVISTEENISDEAIRYFKDQFIEDYLNNDFDILNCISPVISSEENEVVTSISSMEEIKEVVFALKGDSVGGPDGFTRIFYQYCWDIVGEDIELMIRAFFCGLQLPKFITYINLVLIPKKDRIDRLEDLRPISLCYFVNKIFFKLILGRLSSVIPTSYQRINLVLLRAEALLRMCY